MINDNSGIDENETSVKEGKWMFISFVIIMTIWVFSIIKQPFAFISYGILMPILCGVVIHNTTTDPRCVTKEK